MLFGNIEWKKLEVLTSILPMQGVDIITPVQRRHDPPGHFRWAPRICSWWAQCIYSYKFVVGGPSPPLPHPEFCPPLKVGPWYVISRPLFESHAATAPVGGVFLFLPVTPAQVRPILTTPYNTSRDISKKVG